MIVSLVAQSEALVTRSKLPRIGPVGVDQLEQASQGRRTDQGSTAHHRNRA